MKVNGTNPCTSIRLDFGDGSVQVFQIAGLPFSTTHAYAPIASRFLTITASGVRSCGGQASVTVFPIVNSKKPN